MAAIIMSLNLKSKLKPLLNNLCRAFSNAPLPVSSSKDKKSKFIVPQSTGPGRLDCLFISIGDTTTAHKVEKYITYPKGFHHPVATCNGLVLLLFGESYDKDTNAKTSPAGEALWNPTTNQLKILPPSPASMDQRDNFSKLGCKYFGFGFDSASEDYKVIRFLKHKGMGIDSVSRGHWTPMVAELYSLATNSWKPVNIRPYSNPFGPGILVNDSYYWLNISELGFIMSFNFSSEKFASCPIHVPQSDKLDSPPYCNLKLVEFCGSLGAVVDTSSCTSDPIRSLEVWVWDDDIWTWSLACTFNVPHSMSAWSLVGRDKIIFVDSYCDLMVFDFATSKLEKIAGAPRALVSNILPFVESYVPLGNNK